ncbi:hypothetical protein [Magnetospira sp. QH-2]|uniref:hypothetical protein n=1 Tax=Magnetospira sp. (strain QH-2) TaxID=1288970 RepID=UPI0003E8167D|nr:hypothetical protein [Magnetospira sp. QH-2]CCQ75183.1 exported protein of unknown function [Magnetospira sp. QH-2]
MRVIHSFLALTCLMLAVPAMAQQAAQTGARLDLTKEVPPEPPGLFHSTVLMARPGQPEMPKASTAPAAPLPSFAAQPEQAPAAPTSNAPATSYAAPYGAMPQQPYWQGSVGQPATPYEAMAPQPKEPATTSEAPAPAAPPRAIWRPAWPQPYGYGYAAPGYGYAPPPYGAPYGYPR